MILSLTACAMGGGYQRPEAAGPAPKKLRSLDIPKAAGLPQKEGESYFDPNGGSVALYDTRGHREQRLGPYFTVGDFARSGSTHFEFARIDVELANCLNRVRSSLQRPIGVSSSYRSWAHNQALIAAGERASPGSYHLSGRAADVKVRAGVNEFARTLFGECGCRVGLGVANSFYHVDVRGHRVQPWSYGRGIDDLRVAQARAVQKAACGGGGADTHEVSEFFRAGSKKVIDTSGSLYESAKEKAKDVYNAVVK